MTFTLLGPESRVKARAVFARSRRSLFLFGALGALSIACTTTGVGTGQTPSPASSSQPPSSDTTGDDAGPAATLYATYGTQVAPSYFFDPSASSFAAGYTVITANTIEEPDANDTVDTLPTVIDLTLKFPSAVGTYECAPSGDVAVEIDASRDSNSNLREVGTTVGADSGGTCTITVTAIDQPTGRITGTFETFLTTGKLSGGVFDLPHYAAQ